MRITRQSKKEELWRELERLQRECEQERTRRAVLEDQVERLSAEKQRLLDSSRYLKERSSEAQARNERLEILATLTRELASFDLDAVVEVSVQRIPYLVEARTASVYLYDPEQNRLVLKQYSHDREIDGEVRLDEAPNSLMAVAVRERRTLCIDDLGTSAPGDVERPHRARYQTPSCMIVPLLAAGEVEGVLNLADRFDGAPFDPDVHLQPIRQACDLLAVSIRNARLFRQLQRAARTCSLTELLNAQAFHATLDTEARRAERYENELALVVARLEGFRLINANYGHETGDAVLRRVARLVAQSVRRVDVTGRTGGAEFGIILPEQSLAGARTVAERLNAVVAEAEFQEQESSFQLRARFGIQVYRAGMSSADMFQQALEALDRARERDEAIGWESVGQEP